MKKHKASIVRIVATVLLILMVLAVFLPTFFSASAASVSSLQSELNNVIKEKSSLEKKISSSKNSKTATAQKKQQQDKENELLQKQIDISDRLLAELEAELKILETDGDVVEAKLAQQNESYKRRIRAAYEQGPITYLDVLLDSKSVGAMLTRIDMISSIMDADKKIVESLTRLRNELNDKIAAIEKNKGEQQALREDIVAAKASLAKKLKENESYIASLEKDIKAYEKALNEIEREEAKIRKSITEELNKNSGEYVGGVFIWPTPGYTRRTSEYGMRLHPTLGTYKMHYGVDIGAANNTQVLAANSGKVKTATYSSSYGNYIVIDHGGGMATLYAHMNKLLVSVGDTVTQGQKIGFVGSTGWSTGPHLHFEVFENGSNVNPMKFFTKV